MPGIRSMTAFARSEKTGESGAVVVELRSVNHRYLDSHFKLPEELRPLEPQMRERLADNLSRGKTDCVLKLQNETDVDTTLVLDEQLVTRLIEATDIIAERLSHSAPVDPLALLQYPGVVRSPAADSDILRETAMQAFTAALNALVTARAREGSQLAVLLEQRLDAMTAATQNLRGQLPDLQRRLRERLQQRLAALDVEVDSGRLEQELVYLAQKSDVEEELDRLETHADAVRQALDAGGPCGRRLDFLMQELNREANTLSSKSTDSALTACAVELKVLVEQMREQVQNIE